MAGGESVYGSSSRFRASNALSHVYIQYPPLRFNIPGSRFFCDDGNKLMISLTADRVVSWKVLPYDPHVSAALSDPISEGPVLSIRYSLDLKLMAVQRSSHEIQIWNRETRDTFTHKCRPESESILGFFWSDCPSCNIVLVKTNGLDFYVCNSSSRSLQFVETKKLNISWYIYTHESRLVLLASGLQCKSVTGYQLSSAGTIRLPKFDMVMAQSQSEANNKPILAAEDVHIITVYGRIYCLQLDRGAMLLHIYRCYRDAVVKRGFLPVYSSRIAFSVIDNALLVHQLEAKVVILYDLFQDSLEPISAPLPLLLKGYFKSIAASGASESNKNCDNELATYGDQWLFLVPDLVCDVANGVLWKIRLDLEAISASSSEVPLTLEFLQRRKLEADKNKRLCMSIVHNTILERKPVSLVARALDVLLIAYSHAIKSGSYYKRITDQEASASTSNLSMPEADDSITTSRAETKQESESDSGNESSTRSRLPNVEPGDDLRSKSRNRGAVVDELSGQVSSVEHHQSISSSSAVSPSDLHTFVFASVEEEMVRDGSYLISILVEFLHRANREKLKVYPDTYALMIRLLARDEHFSLLGLFIANKIIEPSKEAALQLLESGNSNLHTRKLGIRMMRELSFHDDYVSLLVKDGCYLEALRYVKKNNVTTIQPSTFLEAAYASNDPQHVATILRFFSDFVPGFNNTADNHTYHRILGEMNC